MKNKSNKLIVEYDCKLERKQISYAFQRIITPLAIASYYEPYKDDWQEIKKVLEIVCKWEIAFEKDYKLADIYKEDLQYVDKVLYDLDGKYLSTDGIYMEDAYIWFEQIAVLYNKQISENK